MNKSLPKNNQERREQIMNAALSCFFEKGIRATTIKDIARNFGMSVGHVYNYFESKEAIIEAIVERSFEKQLQLANVVSIDEKSFLEKMSKVMDSYLDPKSARLMISILNESADNKKLDEIIKRIDKAFKEVLLQAIAKEARFKVTPKDFELRFLSTQCTLYGLRVAVFLNPSINKEELKKKTLERLMAVWKMEREMDAKMGLL